MRAIADLIRRAFELGAFHAGPYAEVGDTIRPWLSVANTIMPQDGLETPLWVPVVWNLVLDRVLSPSLFSERVRRIHERAKLLAEPDSHDRQFWQLAVMPGPKMLEEAAKHGWSIDIEVTKEEVAAVANAIDKEADRIGAQNKKRSKPKGPKFDATAGKLLFLTGESILLTRGEKYVLEILVSQRTASFAELQAVNDRPDKVLKRLREKYPKLKKFISLPGGGGKGGYSTTIESSEAE